MSQENDTILDQAVKASALERMRSPKMNNAERHARFCSALDYAPCEKSCAERKRAARALRAHDFKSE